MKKRILVPIDFQVESLNTLKLALKQHADNEVIVHLVYGELLDESITRMLFYDPARIIKKTYHQQLCRCAVYYPQPVF